jgi:hypothetical protein
MAKSTLNPPPPALTSSKQAATFDYRVSTSKLKRIQLPGWVRGRNPAELDMLSSASTGVIPHLLTLDETIGDAGDPVAHLQWRGRNRWMPTAPGSFTCRADTGTGNRSLRRRSISLTADVSGARLSPAHEVISMHRVDRATPPGQPPCATGRKCPRRIEHTALSFGESMETRTLPAHFCPLHTF